ncbi:Hexose transporter 2 [Hypsibius exemplaris]|uniref:Hexose transporter 2 n=1 Tax=Hypsibius exemplaris TaxID=2072580 RepID=A0A1W0XDA3_HYPEX|nr:Hexose transporter 2 [Hypsibius exemplaris]
MGKFYNYLVAVASAMGGFLFGYEIGIIDQVLHMEGFGLIFGLKEKLQNTTIDTAQNPEVTGWITSTFLLGCVVGAAVSGVLTDSIGRRFSILIGSLLFVIGGAMQTGASVIGVLYAGRVVSGGGVGLMSAAVPLYIAETAPTETRGRLISIYQLMVTFGILIASCVNAAILSTLTGELEWRLAMGMQIIPAAILLLLIIILPFSPRWLVAKKRDAEALTVLARLRNAPEKSEVVQTEFRGIKQEQDEEDAAGSVSWLELLQKGVRMRVFLGSMLQLFQQWTGINVILYYAATLFTNMGFSMTDSSVTFVVVNAAINFIATFPGMWLVERIGRTKLMIGGGLLMGLSHCLICLFIGLTPRLPSLSWGAVIFIYVFTIAFAASWGPVVWVYQSEIFPINCRAKGTSICTISNWAWNAIIAKITPIFFRQISFYTYLIFGGMGFVMAAFVFFFVPETEGKSMEEMDKVFGRVPQTKASLEKDIPLRGFENFAAMRELDNLPAEKYRE